MSIVPVGEVNYGQRMNQVDLRLGKIFGVQRVRLKGMLDIYNLFNSNVVTYPNIQYGATTGVGVGAPWQVPRAILPARLLKVSAQIDY